MPAQTSHRHYPYPLDPERIDVAGDMQRLATAIDTDVNTQVGRITSNTAQIADVRSDFAAADTAITNSYQNADANIIILMRSVALGGNAHSNLRINGGYQACTYNSDGEFTVNFPTDFDHQPFCIAGNASILAHHVNAEGGATGTQMTVIARKMDVAGAPIAASTVGAFWWLAIGRADI